ncbi:MAG: fused MFS/spermidine synthase [Myxococcota bacterium]
MSPSRRAFLGGAAALLATTRARAGAPQERELERATSAYNEVVITQAGSVRTMYFVQGGRWLIESRIDLDDPTALDLDVFRTMSAGLLVQPRPARILMVGVGGGQLSNYLFARLPGVEIDAVDIDPEVVRLARKYFEIPDDPRYRTHVGDGRLFVEQSSAADVDMLILDAFRGTSVPYHLRTRTFYEACRRRLRPGGVVVANLHNRAARYADDRTTFASVFAHDYGFVSEREYETTLVCTADAAPVSVYTMRRNAAALRDRFGAHLPRLASALHLRADVAPGTVLQDDFAAEDAARGVRRHNESCRPTCDGD